MVDVIPIGYAALSEDGMLRSQQYRDRIMEQARLIETIAREIVQQTFYENLPHYAVLILLLFLATATAGYVGSYFQARGQRAATDADLKKILAQVEHTTRLTKDIEIRLGLADWTVKERITLRRDRLERVVRAGSALEEWLFNLANIRVFGDGEGAVGVSEMSDFQSLTMLYFPELDGNRVAITEAFNAVETRINEARLECIPVMTRMAIATHSNDVQERQLAGDERLEVVRKASSELIELRFVLSKELLSLRLVSADLMHEMLEIDRPTVGRQPGWRGEFFRETAPKKDSH